jgi:hypothetical protein
VDKGLKDTIFKEGREWRPKGFQRHVQLERGPPPRPLGGLNNIHEVLRLVASQPHYILPPSNPAPNTRLSSALLGFSDLTAVAVFSIQTLLSNSLFAPALSRL